MRFQDEVWVVHEQFRLLDDLQQIDVKLETFAGAQQRLPEKLQPYEQACVEARDHLAHAQAEVEQAERERRTLERELEIDQERLIRTQNRLREIKTNKEYSAVLVEIDSSKQRILELEDRVLNLMETVEQQRRLCQDYEQQVQAAVQELERQGQLVEDEQRSLAQQITVVDAERTKLVTTLDADLYSTYQRIAARHGGGLAAVHVVDGACEGCHLRVRPQLVSEIRRQETIVTCPHCQRVLLWPTY